MIEPLLQAERLLLHGMVDQAEQLYRQVAEQDPRNSIAVVGLARVALERGDDEGALAHARAALQIDPQNAAAVRMEARLSEVLAGRSAAAAAITPPQSQPTEPEADVRPSEQAVFARNPSMADHRHRGQQPRQRPPRADAAPRRGLLARLLHRGRKG